MPGPSASVSSPAERMNARCWLKDAPNAEGLTMVACAHKPTSAKLPGVASGKRCNWEGSMRVYCPAIRALRPTQAQSPAQPSAPKPFASTQIHAWGCTAG